MVTFSETGSLTENVAEQDMNAPKWSTYFGYTPPLLFKFQAILDELDCGCNCFHQQRHYLTFFKEFSKYLQYFFLLLWIPVS